jgi:hypothetical protein
MDTQAGEGLKGRLGVLEDLRPCLGEDQYHHTRRELEAL